MEERTLLVINATVDKQNMNELQEYLNSVMQIFGKNGGKPVGRYKTLQPLIGKDSPEMVAILEFPDANVITKMINGDEFMALGDLRSRVFSKLNMLICAEM